MRRHRNLEEEFAAIAPAGRRALRPIQTIAVGFTNVAGTGGAPASGSTTAGAGNAASSSFSQAAQEISALEEQFRQQSALIQANTQALQNNTSTRGSSTGGSSATNAVTGFLGGGLGFLSPVVTGLAHLFGLGGGSQAPAPLPNYVAPPAVQIGESLRQGVAPAQTPSSEYQSAPAPVPLVGTVPPPPQAQPQISQPAPVNATVAPATQPQPQVGQFALASQTSVPQNTPTPPAAESRPVAPNPPNPPAAPSITVNVSAMDSQSFLDRSNDIASAVREAMLNLHPINDVIANL